MTTDHKDYDEYEGFSYDEDGSDDDDWTPVPRYEILSTARNDATDVIEWGVTDVYWKAEWIFLLVQTHAERLGLGVVSLRDRDRQASRLTYRVGDP